MKIFNLKKKRVCDQSEDKKFILIKRDGCVTRISANRDGTLLIRHYLEKK